MITTTEVDGSQRMVQSMLTIPDTQLGDGGVYMCTAGQDGRNATEPPESMAILCVTGKFSVNETTAILCVTGKFSVNAILCVTGEFSVNVSEGKGELALFPNERSGGPRLYVGNNFILL